MCAEPGTDAEPEPEPSAVYTAEEERLVAERLEALGYIE